MLVLLSCVLSLACARGTAPSPAETADESTAPVAASAAASPSEFPADFPLFALLDQNDEPFPRAKPMTGLVVIFVGNNVREQSTLWSEYLSAHLPVTCIMAQVLDLRSMSRASKGIVTRSINLQSDEGTHIWLDWEGKLADQLGVSLDRLNIICFDRDGTRLLAVSEDFTEAGGQKILALYSDK